MATNFNILTIGFSFEIFSFSYISIIINIFNVQGDRSSNSLFSISCILQTPIFSRNKAYLNFIFYTFKTSHFFHKYIFGFSFLKISAEIIFLINNNNN